VGGGDKVNTDAYLSRLGLYRRDVSVDVDGLKRLQREHLLHVPFENLDIARQRPIVLDTDRFYQKIVEEGRGGFCYELNGLFNALLRELGFRTRLISARVFTREGDFGPEFDHMAIIVTIGEAEYLADVGFGDFTAEPLRFETDIEQHDREGVFVLKQGDDGYFEVAKKTDGVLTPEYRLTPQERDLAEFAAMCDFQQYSSDSHFRKGKVCSLLTSNGRKTLTDKRFVVTSGGGKTETVVDSDDEFDETLMREFGIAAIRSQGVSWQ
jgi:N-hydroxyarylamine O-acetyltransferase